MDPNQLGTSIRALGLIAMEWGSTSTDLGTGPRDPSMDTAVLGLGTIDLI